MADIKSVTLPDNNTYNFRDDRVDDLIVSEHTSTSTRRTRYTKFSDGSMIAGIYVKVTATVSTKWTNIYYGSVSLGSWPSAFAETPCVTATVCAQTGSQDAWISLSGTSSTSIGNAFLYRPASTSSGSYEINIVAFGRWK